MCELGCAFLGFREYRVQVYVNLICRLSEPVIEIVVRITSVNPNTGFSTDWRKTHGSDLNSRWVYFDTRKNSSECRLSNCRHHRSEASGGDLGDPKAVPASATKSTFQKPPKKSQAPRDLALNPNNPKKFNLYGGGLRSRPMRSDLRAERSCWAPEQQSIASHSSKRNLLNQHRYQ